MNLPKSKTKSAFTLIELLVVVVILAIIAGAMMPSFLGYANERSLNRMSNVFLSDINLVRNKSSSGAVHIPPPPATEPVNVNWGMRLYCQNDITNHLRGRYDLGYYNAGFTTVQSRYLPPGYTFCPDGASSNIFLFFERLTGRLVNSASTPIPSAYFPIFYKRDTSQEKIINFTVYQNGKIDIQYP